MIFVILYVLSTAIAVVSIHFIGLQMPDMLLIFLSTTYAIIFFHIINFNKIGQMYKVLENKKLHYLFLISTMLIVWIGAFYIPIYYLPSIHLVTAMSVISSIGALMIFIQNKNVLNFLKTFFLISNLIVFYYISSNYYSGSKYIILVIATIINPIATYLYYKVSANFNKSGYSVSQILAIRFWLLWLVSFISVLYNHDFHYLNTVILLKTLLVSIMSLIIPIYFSQKAIEAIGPEQTSLWIGFTPFAAFLLERIFLNKAFNYTGYFAISLSAILIIFYILSKIRIKG